MKKAAVSVTEVTVMETPACFMARAIWRWIGNDF